MGVYPSIGGANVCVSGVARRALTPGPLLPVFCLVTGAARRAFASDVLPAMLCSVSRFQLLR